MTVQVAAVVVELEPPRRRRRGRLAAAGLAQLRRPPRDAQRAKHPFLLGRIRKRATGTIIGNDFYTAAGGDQQFHKRQAAGTAYGFAVQVENDGDLAGDFTVTAAPIVGPVDVKYYVGYYAGKRSFFTVEVQRQRLNISLNLDPTSTSPWNEKAMRDVREIGHFGLGDTAYSLRAPGQLDEVKGLVKQAYVATR